MTNRSRYPAAWESFPLVVGPHQSRTTVYRLLPRLIRRPGAKDPDHEYVADIAVDRHHHDRRYAPAGLIEYLDAGGPGRAGPAPGTTSATAARRERDRGQQARARAV
jgi:hypothetical protein